MRYLFIVFILFCVNSFSQDFTNAIQKLKKNNIQFLDSIDIYNLSNNEKIYLEYQLKYLKYGLVDTVNLNKKIKKDTKNLIFKNLILGDFYLSNKISNQSLSFKSYKEALENAITLNDKILITETLKKIFNLLYKSRKAIDIFPKYLKIYNGFLYDDNEIATYLFYLNTIHASINQKENIKKLKKGKKIAFTTNNNLLLLKYNQIISLQYQYFKKNMDSAIYFNKEALKIINKNKLKIIENELLGINLNIGLVYQKLGDISKSNFHFLIANSHSVPSYRLIEKVKLNKLLSDNFLKIKNYKRAIEYSYKSNKYNDTLNEYKKAIALNEIEVKYETEKKEKENLQLKQDNLEIENKRKQNQNLLIGSLLFIIFAGTIATLSLKNSKRKRKLAEQQKELETQKNITFLKEQELTTINAMVDGQEKERKQIAEDLHDNLGSVLATLKLHFDNLKINKEKKKINQDELFNKTEGLIDEAYLKVRSIAHAKNAGVIANQGLLTAVQMMAEKISSADKIQIEVIDFGLNKRLENGLEITVFRIIQELITNIIKHAEAKNATINISLYDKILNIIVEDDGKGFDINKVNFKSGMGIGSIKTRIAHLNGSFEVDSTINKGTSVIIDIPIV